jgi:hypothetical protein
MQSGDRVLIDLAVQNKGIIECDILEVHEDKIKIAQRDLGPGVRPNLVWLIFDPITMNILPPLPPPPEPPVEKSWWEKLQNHLNQ